MPQVVELLPNKHRVLSSNSHIAKRKEKKRSCELLSHLPFSMKQIYFGISELYYTRA
jgi:hypothetical protein